MSGIRVPGQFSLELHADKTRLIEFGRYGARNRERRGNSKPETFDFLGITHICEKNKNGRFMLRRITISKQLREVVPLLFRQRLTYAVSPRVPT